MNLFPKPPSILQTINEQDKWPNFVWEAFKQEVKAEQVFALGGVPAGTTFPTSPASYTLFFRTDLNKLFVYLP